MVLKWKDIHTEKITVALLMASLKIESILKCTDYCTKTTVPADTTITNITIK